MEAYPEKIHFADEEPLGLHRQREFLAAAYNKVYEHKIRDTCQLPAEVVQAACSALPRLIEENRLKLPAFTRSKLPQTLTRLEKWFNEASEDEIVAEEGTSITSIQGWTQGFPKHVAKAVKWEDLLDSPELDGLVTPEVRALGPRDILKHPKKRYKLFQYGRLMDVVVLEDSLQHTTFDWRAALYPLPGDERGSSEKQDQ